MPDTEPSMLPPASAGGSISVETAPSAPSTLPPGQGAGASRGPGTGGARVSTAVASLQAPTLRPGAAGAAGAVTATWQSNVHITGLWSINQDRNCWVHLDTVGWRNLSGASESGLVAMNMIAAHGYQLGSTSSLYEEDDGRISQLYVW